MAKLKQADGWGYTGRENLMAQVYVAAALLQIILNYFKFKKEVFSDWKVFAAIIIIVAALYLIYPFIIR